MDLNKSGGLVPVVERLKTSPPRSEYRYYMLALVEMVLWNVQGMLLLYELLANDTFIGN